MRQVTRQGQIRWAVEHDPPPRATWSVAERAAWERSMVVIHRTLTLLAMIAVGLAVGLAAGFSR